MVKYEFFVLVDSILMFLARISVAAVFLYYGNIKSAIEASVLAVYYLVFLFILLLIKFYYQGTISRKIFSKKYKKLLRKKTKYNILVARMYKKVMQTRFMKVRHYVWYLYQVEIIISTIYFSYSLGWGYGFDLFIITLSSYFYLNLRKFSKKIFLFPVFYFLIYMLLFLTSNKVYNDSMELIIYIINGVFAISVIVATQIIIELGEVIKLVNKENRKKHFQKLTSFDYLTETYHKYSFLEIINANLEHSLEEDMIIQASVIIIEINNLRRINENYTIELGNEILKEFAYMLRKNSENYEKYIVRWSGNEFLIFMLNENQLVVKNFIDEIRLNAAKNSFGIRDTRIQVVIGFAHTNNFDYQLDPLIAEAYKELLYQKEKLIYEKGDL